MSFPDVLLGHSHSFSLRGKGLVFAALVVANHTRLGGRIRKWPDLFDISDSSPRLNWTAVQ